MKLQFCNTQSKACHLKNRNIYPFIQIRLMSVDLFLYFSLLKIWKSVHWKSLLKCIFLGYCCLNLWYANSAFLWCYRNSSLSKHFIQQLKTFFLQKKERLSIGTKLWKPMTDWLSELLNEEASNVHNISIDTFRIIQRKFYSLYFEWYKANKKVFPYNENRPFSGFKHTKNGQY